MAAVALKAIAHPLRLRICQLLIDHKRLTVTELAELIGTSANTVSQNLKTMRAYQIVQDERKGRFIRYRVVHPAARSIIACMRRNIGRG